MNFSTSQEIRLERERRLILKTQTGSGQRTLWTPLPSPSHYIVTLGVIISNNRNNSYAQGGVLVTDGTKLVTLHQLSTGIMESGKWNNSTSFSSLYWNSGWRNSSMLWYRWVDDGTNRSAHISHDGFIYNQLHSIGRTDFLTATGVGIFYDPNSGGLEGSISLFDFRIEPYGRANFWIY